jgi:hypothetical protein
MYLGDHPAVFLPVLYQKRMRIMGTVFAWIMSVNYEKIEAVQKGRSKAREDRAAHVL